MTAPGTGLSARVRRLLLESGAPLTRATVTAAVRALGGGAVNDAVVRRVGTELRTELLGIPRLAELLDDPAVSDVLINGLDDVWVDRGAGLARVELPLSCEQDLRNMVQRLAVAAGRRLDEAKPWVDARLPDGTRLHAVIEPIAVSDVYVSFRTFRSRAFTLAELVDLGSVAPQAASLIRGLLRARLAFLVTGATASGKTTVLGSLLGELPHDQRIAVIEEDQELCIAHPHVVGLQTRSSNAEGAGAVGLRDLVKQSLRMRPDRIVIGECRGPEVIELLCALNTGHEGGAGTLHANSPADVPARLEALAALGGLDRQALHSQLGSALRCVLHMRRRGRERVLDEIALLRSLPVGRGREVVAVTAWAADDRPTPGAADLLELLDTRGAL